jgi:hypothetical protein
MNNRRDFINPAAKRAIGDEAACGCSAAFRASERP